MLRLELLNTKAAFERQLELLVLDFSASGQRVHYVPGSASRRVTGRTEGLRHAGALPSEYRTAG